MSQIDLPIRTKAEEGAESPRDSKKPPIPFKKTINRSVRRGFHQPLQRNGTPHQPAETGSLHRRETPSKSLSRLAGDNLKRSREVFIMKNPRYRNMCFPGWWYPRCEWHLISPYRIRVMQQGKKVNRLRGFERKHGLKGLSKEESDAVFKAEDDLVERQKNGYEHLTVTQLLRLRASSNP